MSVNGRHYRFFIDRTPSLQICNVPVFASHQRARPLRETVAADANPRKCKEFLRLSGPRSSAHARFHARIFRPMHEKADNRAEAPE